MPCPFRVDADFEAANISFDDNSIGKIKKLSQQVPSAAFCIVIDINNKIRCAIREDGQGCEIRMLELLRIET